MPDQQKLADAAFLRWKQDPRAVQYKPITQGRHLKSARIGKEGRAISREYQGKVEWLWIGFNHRDYEKAIAKLAALGY